MEHETDCCFSIEATLYLREYLQRHPDRWARIAALARGGRLEWGATYAQPYEPLESSEMLARQLYDGRKWLGRAGVALPQRVNRASSGVRGQFDSRTERNAGAT